MIYNSISKCKKNSERERKNSTAHKGLAFKNSEYNSREKKSHIENILIICKQITFALIKIHYYTLAVNGDIVWSN